MSRRAAIALTVVLLVPAGALVAAAQSAQSASRSPSASASPEEQAFRAARAQKEPAERLAALTKFKADFPASAYVTGGTVDFNLFVAACESGQAAIAEARRASEAWFERQPLRDADSLAWNAYGIAARFFMAGLWSDAERFARRSLEAWDSRKTDRPAVMFRQKLTRPEVLAILGSALFELGRTGEARPALEEAFRQRAQAPTVLGQVGPRLVQLADDESKADYLMTLALYGRLRSDGRAALEDAWRSSHAGSVDGLEAALDERYQREVRVMVQVEPWSPPALSGRVALLEVFTGTSCAPCAGVDLAVEGAMRRYGESLAVLAYHQHVPAADPLANPSGAARQRYYGQEGVPALVIEGKLLAAQGGGTIMEAQQILDGLRPSLETRLTTASPTRLDATARLSGSVVTAQVTGANARAGTAPIAVMLALAEKQVRYSGGNGIRFHPVVVRQLVKMGQVADGRFDGRQTIDLKAAFKETQASYAEYQRGNPGTGTLVLPEIDPGNLVVVAFLQDEGTKEVLQAATAPVLALRW